MRLLPRMMFDDFFDDMFDEPLLHRNAITAMRCDIREKDGSYLLDIELPGYDKEDIKMDLENGYLTVSAGTCPRLLLPQLLCRRSDHAGRHQSAL